MVSTWRAEKVFPIHYGTGNTAHLDVTGIRGEAIRTAMMEQLAVDISDITPIGLAGSSGSTPLRICQHDGPELFAKIYARSHLRSDRAGEAAMPIPDCARGASMVIGAQSVPDAAFVPCFEPLPVGWSVAAVIIDDRGSAPNRSGRSGPLLMTSDEPDPASLAAGTTPLTVAACGGTSTYVARLQLRWRQGSKTASY